MLTYLNLAQLDWYTFHQLLGHWFNWFKHRFYTNGQNYDTEAHFFVSIENCKPFRNFSDLVKQILGN